MFYFIRAFAKRPYNVTKKLKTLVTIHVKVCSLNDDLIEHL